MASRRRDRRQAVDEAFLRYGGEADQLTSLLRSIKGDTRSQVQQARRAARMLGASARQAIPKTQRHYDTAATAAQVHDAAMKGDLEKLGPAAAGFQAALAFESGGNARLAESKADALQELVGRASGAKAQGVAEVRAIRASGRADKAKVLDQLLSNQKQAGTYAASRFSELRGDSAKVRNENKQKAKDRAQRERASKRSAGIDPATGKPIPGGKLDPKAKPKDKAGKRAAIKDSRKAISQVENAQTVFTTYSGMKDDQGRKPSAAQVRTRMISEGFNNREIDVALDLQRNDGRLSSRGVRAAKELGIIIPPRWKPKNYEAQIQSGKVAGPPAPR